MKNVILTLAAIGTFSSSFANNPGAKHAFQDPNADVALEVERSKGEVVLHILAQEASQFDHIIIERSGNGGEFYSQVKYVQIDSEVAQDGNYILKSDKFPLSATTDAFYRIKTVAKDGATTVYPSVELAGN